MEQLYNKLLEGNECDKFLEHNGYIWNFQDTVKANKYLSTYGEIETVITGNNKKTIIIQSGIQGNPNIYNNVSLLIKNPTNISLNNFIKSIRIDINGQKIDEYNNLSTNIGVLCSIFNKKCIRSNNELIIPLFGPFANENMINFGSQEVKIIIEFENNINILSDDIKVYGTKYIFQNSWITANSFMQGINHVIYQTQYIGPDSTLAISRNYKFKMNFKNPTSMLVFFGINKHAIKSIKLQFNGRDYIDTKVQMLDYNNNYKINNFAPDISGNNDPFIIKFSDEFYKSNKGTINFSLIDNATLCIETEDIYQLQLHMIAISTNILTYGSDNYWKLKY